MSAPIALRAARRLVSSGWQNTYHQSYGHHSLIALGPLQPSSSDSDSFGVGLAVPPAVAAAWAAPAPPLVSATALSERSPGRRRSNSVDSAASDLSGVSGATEVLRAATNVGRVDYEFDRAGAMSPLSLGAAVTTPSVSAVPHLAIGASRASDVPVRMFSTEGAAAVATSRPVGEPRFAPGAFESPHKKGLVLEEKSVGQMFANLRHLAGGGKVPRVSMLHRLLRRVETAEDLRFALAAIKLCRTRFVAFTHHTAALIVDACIRAGDLDAAFDLIARREELRLWPGRETYHRLLVAASVGANEGVFNKTLVELRGSEHPFVPRTIHIAVRAHVDFGDLSGALDSYEEAGALSITVKRGTLNVLCNGIVETDDLPLNRKSELEAIINATAACDHPVSQTLATRAREHVVARAAAAADAPADDGDAEAEGEDSSEEAKE